MIEIERKFLVDTSKLPPLNLEDGQRIVQTYLKSNDGIDLRLRIKGDIGYITVKKEISNRSRKEIETLVEVDFVEELIHTFELKKIEKTRFKIAFVEKTWEIDFFEGKHEGLVLAEIELNQENEDFEKPSWMIKEVTHDKRYYNTFLFDQL